jgi:hypothetical protein
MPLMDYHTYKLMDLRVAQQLLDCAEKTEPSTNLGHAALALFTQPDHALLLHAEDKIAAIKQQEDILRKVIT